MAVGVAADAVDAAARAAGAVPAQDRLVAVVDRGWRVA